MASHDPSLALTDFETSFARAKVIVEAQLDHSVPHEYVVPDLLALPAGLGAVVYDADGRVIGGSVDLASASPDPESVSFQLAHPVSEPEPEPEPSEPTAEQAAYARKLFEEQAALDRYRRQFSDKSWRGKAKDALVHRKGYARKTPEGTRTGRPRKYDDKGLLTEFAPKE